MTCRGMIIESTCVGRISPVLVMFSTPQRHGREDGDRDVQDVRQHTGRGAHCAKIPAAPAPKAKPAVRLIAARLAPAPSTPSNPKVAWTTP